MLFDILKATKNLEVIFLDRYGNNDEIKKMTNIKCLSHILSSFSRVSLRNQLKFKYDYSYVSFYFSLSTVATQFDTSWSLSLKKSYYDTSQHPASTKFWKREDSIDFHVYIILI